MLPKKKLIELKEELDNCNNPLFIYDKDSDGLCSFLLFYKYKKAGHGMVLSTRTFDEGFLRKVKSYEPDKIFFLDIPVVPEEFIQDLKIPAVHVDHHLGQEKIPGLKRFNPRDFNKKDDTCTSSLCYGTVKENLWIAASGTVSDWQLNSITKKFSKEFPKFLSSKIKNPGEAMFKSKIGKVGSVLNLILKGRTENVNESVKHLVKINSPEEILEEKTEDAKEVMKRYNKVNLAYRDVLAEAEKFITKDKLFVFIYHGTRHDEGEMSFTGELSNELLYKYPKKVLIIAREKNEDMKCSLRSGSVEIRTKLIEAMKGLEGHGGGHDKACGALIKKKDFEYFIEKFRELL
ncbi:DHH family phosphoesterase [Candidatus Woesearchaeota archaeon]|nr:DHH family phosphoesterase [Candidatus Woesearchaeota archaeon]